MTPGWKTSEFALSAAWWFLTAFTTAVVCFSPWHQAACLAPALLALVYMSAAVTNNYGENRFLLKAEKRQDERLAEQEQLKEEPRRIGFGQFVASESDDDEDQG